MLNVRNAISYACRALLAGLVLGGCGGGERDSSRLDASAPAVLSSVRKDVSVPDRAGAQGLAPKPQRSAEAANAEKGAVTPAEESARLAKLRALPLLRSLSERERAGLLRQLPAASPSERLTLINGYPELAELPARQQQVLLDQMEKIVPVAISGNLLVCTCSHDIQRKLCVKERCSNHAELQSICNNACGTLASFKSECLTSRQCSDK